MIELLRCEADEVVCLDEDPGFWAVGQCYEDFSQVSDEDVLRILDAFAAKIMVNASRHVEIRRDGLRLAGILSTPAGNGPFPLVIFVHGLGSSKKSPRNVVIADRLVDEGIATLLFDLSGHGESSSDPEDGIDAYVSDVEAAFAWSERDEDIDNALIGLAGSSLGATVAAMAVAQGRAGPATLVLRAPPMEASQFRAVKVPSLVLIGSRDPLRKNVERDIAGCPELTLSVVDGASHLFEEPGTLQEALERTVGWFKSKLLQPARAPYQQGVAERADQS
jgi:pimeloyl-ACP methyl ester carboxylesterase